MLTHRRNDKTLIEFVGTGPCSPTGPVHVLGPLPEGTALESLVLPG